MRNPTLTLSDEANARVQAWEDRLNAYMANGGTVTVAYVKRDGSASESTGTVAGFAGTPGTDKRSVIVETDNKGPRTINLVGLTDLT